MAIDFPSNPTNGQVYANYIYDSSITAWRNVNTDTGIGTLNAMGLKNVVPSSVVVASGSATVNGNGLVTFSGATSIALDGIFSSTYTNYKIVINANVATGENWIELRLRSGGSTITSANYAYTIRRGESGGTISTDNSGQVNALTAVSGPNAGGNTHTFDINNPFLLTFTNWFGQSESVLSAGTFNMATFGGMYKAATSANGIIINPQGSNLNGTIQCFGYTN